MEEKSARRVLRCSQEVDYFLGALLSAGVTVPGLIGTLFAVAGAFVAGEFVAGALFAAVVAGALFDAAGALFDVTGALFEVAGALFETGSSREIAPEGLILPSSATTRFESTL